MKSLKELYRIGKGPSASHTIGPSRAAQEYLKQHPDASSYKVVLYGSLAATGKGHFTDHAILETFSPNPVEIVFKPNEVLSRHPNGMEFSVPDRPHSVWRVFSVGGGALATEASDFEAGPDMYPDQLLTDLMSKLEEKKLSYWEYVLEHEGDIGEYLQEVWQAMKLSRDRGLRTEGELPGVLKVKRKASQMYQETLKRDKELQRTGLVSSYTLAVSEENASMGQVVTAPTCGACGVLPGCLTYLQEKEGHSDHDMVKALMTAGLIGNMAKTGASISGAEVGCQGEVGVACSMAAAAVAQLHGGSLLQIEYAAEMGIEHFLGLTCDPVAGLVQIPCIERNAAAALRALDCAGYALLGNGEHKISFDQALKTMKKTGEDMKSAYRETSEGGLAMTFAEGRVRNLCS